MIDLNTALVPDSSSLLCNIESKRSFDINCEHSSMQDVCWRLHCDRCDRRVRPTLRRGPLTSLKHITTAMLLTIVCSIGGLAATPPASAAEDALESKLQIGITRDAAIALMNAAPDGESCRTVLGIRNCRLVWQKFFGDRRYEADFLFDRLVGVRVCRNAGTACPSAKAE